MTISTNAQHIQKVYKGGTEVYDDTYGEWQDTNVAGVQFMAVAGIICFKGIVTVSNDSISITLPANYKNITPMTGTNLLVFSPQNGQGYSAGGKSYGELVISGNTILLHYIYSDQNVNTSQILLSYTN